MAGLDQRVIRTALQGLRRPWVLGLLTMTIGWLVAYAAVQWQTKANLVEATGRFHTLGYRVIEDISSRMARYELGLRGLRGAVVAAGGPEITRRQVQAYSASHEIDRGFPGARGFGVIWRVQEQQQSSFVAQARSDGWPDFAVRQLAPHDGDRYVIKYIEPVERNRQAVGLDVASEDNRREAARHSLLGGSATLTGPITLVQAAGKPMRSFLLLLPIYRQGAPVDSVEAREAAHLGWTYAPLVIDEVLQHLEHVRGMTTLVIRDLDGKDNRPFFRTDGALSGSALAPTLTLPLEVHGRTWEVELQATPAFMHSLYQVDPARVGLALAGLSAVLGLLVFALGQAAERQRRSALEQARRAAIVTASNDAIIGVSRDGRITEWNAGAERLFGRPAGQVLGLPAAPLLLPPARQHEDRELLAAVARGALVPPFDSTRLHANGSEIDVSVSVSAILDTRGRCVGMAKVIRDVRDARRARQALLEANSQLEAQVATRTSELHAAMNELRSVVDAIPSPLAYWDRQLTLRLANAAYHKTHRSDAQSLIGRGMRELLGDELFALNRGHIDAALDGQQQSFERQMPLSLGPDRQHLLMQYVPKREGPEVVGFYVIAHDITEVARSRQALADMQRAQAALLQTLDEHALVSVADPQGRIIEVNDRFCSVSGFAREELLGHNHRIVNSGQHPRPFWIGMWQALGRGQTWHGEVCNRAKDGTLYWVDSVITPFFDAAGRIEKFVSIRTDITPLKRLQAEAEAARREAELSQRFLQDLTDRLPLRISYVDHELRYRFINARMRERFGLPADRILGRTRAEIDGSVAPASVVAALQAALRGRAVQFESEELVDGEPHSFETHAVPDLDGDGRVKGFFSVSSDITERKRSDTELRRTLTLLRAVLDASTQVSIIATDPDGLIRVFNKGAEHLLGYAAEQVVGRERSLKFHTREELSRRAEQISLQLGHKVPTGMALVEPAVLNEPHEWTYIRCDGASIPVSLAVTAMRDGQGGLVGYLGIAHDISARVQYERSLRHAMADAQAANQAKSQFLANMSHEIRTPMNAVIGLTYLMERTPLDADQSAMLGKIMMASKGLLSIINDVLDLSKIEAGEMHLERAPLDLRDLLSELRAWMSVQAESKGIELGLQMPDDLPDAVEGDVTRLRQVLTNLLSNAIKFTDRGRVELRVRQLERSAERLLLRFEVQDSGIGIEAEALGRLFTPFVQADTTTTRRFGGTGLGLSIIKQLVALMGGRLGVQSTPGVGSEFWVEVEMPICDVGHAIERLAAAGTPGANLRGMRLMVVDDSPINLEVARRILELEGALVRVALNGQEAIDQLADHAGSVDAVLMDVQMPVLDGHDATRRIRGALGLTQLPIIGLTAGVSTLEKQRASAAGMNDVLGKPFEPSTLIRCLRRHVSVDDAAPEPAAAGPADDGAPSAAPPWPSIDGIDHATSLRRLRGDVDLLRTLLRHLLARFADLDAASIDDATGRAALAARLHDLKGSAGAVGATSLQQTAAQAEAACLQDRPELLQPLLASLQQAIQALGRSAQPLLEPVVPAAAPVAIDPADAGRLRALLRQLQTNDFAAIDLFHRLAPLLQQRLGAAAYQTLLGQIEALSFDAAAEGMRPCVAEPEDAPGPAEPAAPSGGVWAKWPSPTCS